MAKALFHHLYGVGRAVGAGGNGDSQSVGLGNFLTDSIEIAYT